MECSFGHDEQVVGLEPDDVQVPVVDAVSDVATQRHDAVAGAECGPEVGGAEAVDIARRADGKAVAVQ
jgi:hypothetical protein